MRDVFALAVAMAMVLTTPSTASAQEPPDELTPRAIVDSTYAVRVAVDVLLEALRRGDPRRFNDAQLVAAVAGLATAGARRARRPPHPDLGVLWDLQIDLSEFRPEGPNILRVQADVLLATARDSARAPVTLTFRRRGDRWDLVANEGFAARLDALALLVAPRTR